jgi:hypothetical protein
VSGGERVWDEIVIEGRGLLRMLLQVLEVTETKFGAVEQWTNDMGHVAGALLYWTGGLRDTE